MNPDSARLLALLDAIRAQIMTGERAAIYRFAWKSIGSNSIAALTPFTLPNCDTPVHLLLSLGTNPQSIKAGHAQIVDALVESLLQ